MCGAINDSHQWLRQETDGTLVLGLTDLALRNFGEVYGIEPIHRNHRYRSEVHIQQTGLRVNACDRLCTFRSETGGGKIIAPAAGIVCGFNWSLVYAYPSPINQNPFAAWVVKIKPFDLMPL